MRPQPATAVLFQFVVLIALVPLRIVAFMAMPLGLYLSAAVAVPRGYQPSAKN